MRNELNVPVIDGVLFGLKFVEAMVACGAKNNKKGLYGIDA